MTSSIPADGERVDLFEREQLVQALQARELYLSGVIGRVESFVTIDEEWRITFVNATAARLAGKSQEELIGVDVAEVTPSGMLERAAPALREATARRAITEFRVSSSDGEHWFRGRAYPLADGGLAVYLRDFTDEAHAERQLRESEQRYMELVHGVNSAVLRWNRESVLTFMNDYAERLFGWRREEIVGGPVSVLLPGTGGADEPTGLEEEILAEPGQHESEVRQNVCKDGRLVWMAWANRAVLDDQGAVREILAIGNDISELVEAQGTLRETEERSRLLLEGIAQAFWETGVDGVVVADSPSWRAYTGQSLGDLRSGKWLDAVHPDDRELAERRWKEAVTGRTRLDAEFRLRHAPEGYRWTHARAVPLADADGVIVKWLGMNVDIDERKRAELALRESEERYRSIVETASEGIVMTDPRGLITFANQRFAAMLGYEVEEIVGLFSSALIDADLRSDTDQVRARLGTGETIHAEVKFRHRDGHPVWTLYGARPIYDAAGHYAANLAMHIDVTERKRLEDEFARQRQQLEHLIRHAATAIYEIDFRGPRFLSVNDFMCAYSGFSREELLALDPLDLLDEESRTRFRARIERVLAREAIDPQVEYCFVTRSGEKRWAVLNVTPTFLDGQPVGAFVVGQDVTERKAAEEALRESEERFRALADESPFMIWLHDAAGNLSFVNRTYLEFFEVEREEVLGGGWQPLIHPEDRDRYVRAFLVAMREQQTFHCEARVRSASGEWRWIDSLGLPRFSASGQFLGMVGSSPDITERRQAEAALLQAEGEKAAQQERSRLARDLHDSVTQALFAATLKAEALMAGGDASQTDAIADEVRRLNRGALAQMRTLLLELRGDPVEEVPIAQLLRNLAEATESRSSVQVRLTVEEEKPLRPDLHVAAYRIAQEALNNVARHAAAANAWVTLRSGPSGGELSVQDDGRGFVDDSHDPSHLGLALMRERAAEAHAQLTVRAQPEDGTTVRLSWHGAEAPV